MQIEETYSRKRLIDTARSNAVYFANVKRNCKEEISMNNAPYIYAFIFYCRALALQEARFMTREEVERILRD